MGNNDAKIKTSLIFRFVKKLDNRGIAVGEGKVEDIRGLLEAFPERGRRRLQVQADVIERATGNKETVVDNSCHFTSKPYLVDFKNTLKYFKPGFPFVAKVKLVSKISLCLLPILLMLIFFTFNGNDKRSSKHHETFYLKFSFKNS